MTITFLRGGYEPSVSGNVSKEQPSKWAYITNAPRPCVTRLFTMKAYTCKCVHTHTYMGETAYIIRKDAHKCHVPM